MTKAEKEELIIAQMTGKPVERKKGEHLATNEQIARWLAGGGGLVCITNDYPDRKTKVYTSFSYAIYESFDTPWGNTYIKKWEDKEWHEPTLEYIRSTSEAQR